MCGFPNYSEKRQDLLGTILRYRIQQTDTRFASVTQGKQMMQRMVLRGTWVAAAAILTMAPPAFAAEASMYVDYVAASLPDPAGKVPSFDTVPGAAIDTESIGVPLSVVSAGGKYIYNVAWQDGTFKGTCYASFKVTKLVGTTTKVLLTAKTPNISCTPGGQYLWGFADGALPTNETGAATLTGSLHYGTASVSLSAPIYIASKTIVLP